MNFTELFEEAEKLFERGMYKEALPIYRNALKLEKQNQSEVLQKDKIIDSLQTEIKESHHRVKNNLQIIVSLLNQHYHVMKDERLKSLILETENRVKAMVSVYKQLFTKMANSHINIKDYIENLIEESLITYGFSEEELDLWVSVGDKKMDAQKAMKLGLIVNELVSNSFKYAFKDNDHPILKIALDIQENGGIQLCVSDNGPGFNPKKRREDAFGLKLIQTLSKQLNGKAKFTMQEGTKFELVC